MSKTQEQKDKENDFKVTPKLEEDVQDHLQEYLDTIGEDNNNIVGPPPRKKKKDDEKDQDEPNDVDDDEEKDEDAGDTEDGDTEGEEEKDDDLEDGGADGDTKDDVKEYVLPDSHYRAAIHQGISSEDIAGMLEANPEAALKFFEKVHASTNHITQQTSALGRKHLELEKKLVGDIEPKGEVYKPVVDVEAFANEHGENNPAVVAVMKAMVEQGRQQHAEMQALKQQQQPADQVDNSEQERIWKEVNAFFSDSGIQKNFNSRYGSNKLDERWDHVLTGNQFTSRQKLMQEADAYIAGSKLQGVEVTYTEALERAHIASSLDSMAGVAREELKAKVKKRSKGITVKNSAKAKIVKSKKSKEKDFQNKTRERMQKYLGSNPT